MLTDTHQQQEARILVIQEACIDQLLSLRHTVKTDLLELCDFVPKASLEAIMLWVAVGTAADRALSISFSSCNTLHRLCKLAVFSFAR